MTPKSLLVGAVSISAVAVLAGCGSSSSPTPTPSGGLSLPTIPGLGSGTTGNNGSSAGANTLMSVSDIQNISGDPNVTALSCSAETCLYADSASSTGGGGIIVVEPFPDALGQQALEAAVAAALASGGGSSTSGSTTTAVPGLGSAAIKEIDSDSATYAFFKDSYLVVIDVTSGTKSGADMDAQVEAAAQNAAGKL
jgi:hypothetical protein